MFLITLILLKVDIKIDVVSRFFISDLCGMQKRLLIRSLFLLTKCGSKKNTQVELVTLVTLVTLVCENSKGLTTPYLFASRKSAHHCSIRRRCSRCLAL